MRRVSLLCSLVLAWPVVAALGQTAPPPLAVPATVPTQTKDAVGAKKAEPGKVVDDDTSPDAKQTKDSPRMQKLKSLSFDRRPSAILKAWSNMPDVVKKDLKGQKDEKPDPFDLELAVLRRQVSLGEWDVVKAYLVQLPEDEAKAGYKQLLQALGRDRPMGGPGQPGMDGDMMPGPQMNPAMMRFTEKNKFSADDLVGIANAAPFGLDKDLVVKLGSIVRQTVASGTVIEHVVARLQSEAAKPKDKAGLSARQSASLLIAADQAAEIGVFLPTLDKALTDEDHEALNLLARHFLALHVKEKKSIRLEQAWSAIQAILAHGKAERAELEEALKRAVELAPKIREELGLAWLELSFTKDTQRGIDILATLGSTAAQAIQRQPRNMDERLKTLQLQKTAVEALLKAAPDNAKAWRAALTLLAGNWLTEAEFTYQFDRSSSFGPRMRRDPYGNLFYVGDDDMDGGPMMMQQQQPEMPLPVTVTKILTARPSEKWIEYVDDGLKPKLTMVFAQLYLKVNEEARAFPFIEQLSAEQPEKARALVKEFLKVWTRNHNPNAARDYTNPYMFMYGYERRSESIPLTRAKQERNLTELTEWVGKLRALKLGEFDEELLAKAFTTCHSRAEVYRMEAIEMVFGKIDQLKPRTLAGLAQQMRENLGGLWRSPAEQKDKKTNRKLKDIRAEVLRGYALAQSVIDDGIKKFPEQWALTLGKAALLHDENNFRQELVKSSEFSKLRQQALGLFAKAAEQYAAKISTVPEDEETTQVYEQWLYASLGACDLNQITEDKIPDLKQPAMIRKAIMALPGETAERHLGKFANLLFTRLSAVNPAMKFNYLRGGFEIVGDHHLANEARKVFDYYKDLVTEIKLDVALDGSTQVGHREPFGVFVNLKHTREIERESGGFGKYLQNQNSGRYFSYNYGRPTTDYRDKFTSVVTEALKEQFEVLSVTFQTDKVNSRALHEYGWRYTPYAYLLLKARGPQVDKLPPLRMDLDFLDTSGYVIIPIESAAVPMDASSAKSAERPFRKLQVTQTLDERQADKGKLLLEVKATALGIVPQLGQMIDLAPEGFEVEKINDQGVSVVRFDPDSEENAIVSERTVVVALKATPGRAAPPEKFHFGKATVDHAEMAYHRYKDADLVTVPAEVLLEQHYGEPSYAWIWWSVGGFAAAAALLGLAVMWLIQRAPKTEAKLNLPERLSPFTVLSLLKRIESNKKLTSSQQKELQQSMAILERRYFADDGDGDIDLRGVAESWLRRSV